MCTLCAALNPAGSTSITDQHVNAAGDLPSFTLDQIAGQLLDGYWDSVGESRRAFDLDADFVKDARAFGFPDVAPDLLLAAFRLRFRPWARGPQDATDAALMADLAARFPVDRPQS